LFVWSILKITQTGVSYIVVIPALIVGITLGVTEGDGFGNDKL